MPSWKKCFFKCESGESLFTFPSEPAARRRWADFVFGDRAPSVKNPFVCARHFTDDCFLNKSLYLGGQVARLALRPGAAPSLKPAEPAPRPGPWPKPEPTEHVIPTWSRPADPVRSSRSVSTQLSAGTLRQRHYRSKAVQTVITTVRSPELLTQLSPTPINASTSGAKRATKRPRVEEEVEEVEEEESALLTHDSSFEPVDSDPESDLPHFTEMEDEDERYLVLESCLRELLETCPRCKHLCTVQKQSCGASVDFTQDCPLCGYSRTWPSQSVKQEPPTEGPRPQATPIPLFFWPRNDTDSLTDVL